MSQGQLKMEQINQQPPQHQIQNFMPNQQQPQQQPSHHQTQAQAQVQPQHQEHQHLSNPQNDEHDKMTQQLTILFRETQQIDPLIQSSRDSYQQFVFQLQTRSRILQQIRYLETLNPSMTNASSLDTAKRELANIEVVTRRKGGEVNRLRNEIVDTQYSIFERLDALQDRVIQKHLASWHHQQQLISNGAKIEQISLDLIQQWIEQIVDIMWKLKNQIKGLQLTLTDKPNIPYDIEGLDRFVVCINKALQNVIMNAFVVEKQPPQVMKTNTRFQATVRFLCVSKLNVQMINPTVKALILSESNARTVIRYHKQLIENSWASIADSHLANQPVSPHQFPSNNMGNSTISASATAATTSTTITNPTTTTTSTTQIGPNPNPNPLYSQPAKPQQMSMAADHRNHQVQRGYSADFASVDQNHQSFMMMDAGANDQPMSIGPDPPIPSTAQQHFFHRQNHLPQPQHQQHQVQHQQPMGTTIPMAANTVANMTAHQAFRKITEIGYNPEVPIDSKDFETSGDISFNTNVLEYQEATGHIISHLRNMQLKKIKRTEKKGTESVMDEKFILLFFTEFSVADDSFWPYSIKTNSSRVKQGDLLFHILAFSLPVVVIVHGNQEPHAWATVTWHNAFATPDELLYRVPDKVPWHQLGHVLSEKFRSAAGRGLTTQNLQYLASKVYRNRVDNDDVLVSWNQFSKEPLSDKSFTFWEWFHSILKLTKDYLKDLWKADRIYGFIGKKGCVDLLLGSAYTDPAPVGTFLLRYSETELGGITIAWVSNSSLALNPSLNDRVQISQRLSPTNTSPNVVMHLQPFVGKDLNTRSLADRIRDLKDLVYLYPNINKNEAFEAYFTPMIDTHHLSATGYVKPMLVQRLAVNYPGSMSSPNSVATNEVSLTPNSVSQSSPENFYQDGLSMNDMMDSNYPAYDSAVGEFNYSIQ